MIRRSVPSRTATARNAAKRKIAFHHGSRSYWGYRRSLQSAAVVERKTVAAPHRRPRFHVTSPIGMR
jgi:hypothetical protein